VLFLPLFHRENPLAKVRELGEFLPDCFQAFVPLAVSDLSLCVRMGLTPVLVIQLLKVRDLGTKPPDFFT
jgi:hypothetical protein